MATDRAPEGSLGLVRHPRPRDLVRGVGVASRRACAVRSVIEILELVVEARVVRDPSGAGLRPSARRRRRLAADPRPRASGASAAPSPKRPERDRRHRHEPDGSRSTPVLGGTASASAPYSAAYSATI